MSKYNALWEYARKKVSPSFKLTFEEIQSIAGVPMYFLCAFTGGGRLRGRGAKHIMKKAEKGPRRERNEALCRILRCPTAFLRRPRAAFPTPFHLYDEAGIRANARRVNQAFSWESAI